MIDINDRMAILDLCSSYNYLFDKYWYMQREFTYIDAISQVEQAQFSNKQEANMTNKEGIKYNIKD